MRNNRVRWKLMLLVVALWPMAALGRPTDAPGGPEGKGPCVRACTNANRGCSRQAQVNKLNCRYNCADLQETYLIACGIKESDPEDGSIFGGDEGFDPELGCEAAKQEFEACWNPCRVNFSRAARSCVGKLRACYFRQCGIYPPPPRGDGE